MECKHGLDTRWCGVCIHGPRRQTPSRQAAPPAGRLRSLARRQEPATTSETSGDGRPETGAPAERSVLGHL